MANHSHILGSVEMTPVISSTLRSGICQYMQSDNALWVNPQPQIEWWGECDYLN